MEQNKNDIRIQSTLEAVTYSIIVTQDTQGNDTDCEQAIMQQVGYCADRLFQDDWEETTMIMYEGETTSPSIHTYKRTEFSTYFVRVLLAQIYWYFQDVEEEIMDDFIKLLLPVVKRELDEQIV